MNEYQKQAEDFLKATGSTLKINFLKRGKHFPEDKEERDIYEITLSRNNRSFTFTFGNSIAYSGEYKLFCQPYGLITLTEEEKKEYKYVKKAIAKKIGSTYLQNHEYCQNKDFQAPTAYDILACLTKYDPETFEDFCLNYGYDTDSRQAEKIYNAVQNEYNNLKMLYSDDELALMAEIN